MNENLKFSVERASFINALSVGGGLANKGKMSLPCLEMCKVMVSPQQRCKVTSYDGETAIVTRYEGRLTTTISEDVVFLVSPTDVVKYLRAIDDEEVDIELSATLQDMTIRHATGYTRIACDDAHEFPTPKREDGVCSFSLTSDTIVSLLDKARRFVSSDTLRPQMCGVHFSIADGVMSVSATDAHVLFNDNVSVDSASFVGEAIISSRVLTNVLSVVGDGSRTIDVIIGESTLSFKSDTSQIMCRKTEGRFPNVKGVIPTSDAPIVIEVAKKDFTSCVKRATMSANATNPIIRLVASQANDVLCIESEDIDNNRASMERVKKTHTGDDITIGFSGTNLLLAMDAVDDDVVSLHLTADVRPMVVHDALHSRETILIMPMMIRK